RGAVAELALVPVGKYRGGGAGGVEYCDLFGGEVPAYRAQILPELFFVSGADDDVGDGGTLQQPVQGDLRDSLSGFFGDDVQSINYFVQVVIVDRRTVVGGFWQGRNFRFRLGTRNFF